MSQDLSTWLARGMVAEAAPPVRSRAGRRPGSPDTRAAITAAAKQEFSTCGFDKTSMRAVAKAAGVDPALVHHYFSSKDDLFLASLDVPFDPRLVLPELTADGVNGMGARIATRFLAVWDDELNRAPLVALVRSAMTSEVAADLLRSGLVRLIFTPIAAAIGSEDAELRAQCVASQLLGLAMTRYVLGLEPLASTPSSELALRLGPVLQCHIDGVSGLTD